MILAGIDEAGYGPVLGPLVVGCCAFEVTGEGAEAGGELPDLWERLRRMLGRTRDKHGRKLHVNDSKKVYTPASGLKELEKSVLAIVGAMWQWPGTLDEVLAAVAPDALPWLAEHAWYAPAAGEAFPLEQEGTAVRLMANGLLSECERCRARPVYLAARVIPEGELNRLMDLTRNKSSVLFSQAAIHLDFLLREYGARGLVIFCDRQGGREHYGHLLRLMFEDWALEIVKEEDGYCEYLLKRSSGGGEGAAAGEHVVKVIFSEKGEGKCMSVAVASMISKYLREALMRRFNAWWKERMPGIAPTAGYYTDGMRFLADIEVKRRELGIEDAQIIRSR